MGDILIDRRAFRVPLRVGGCADAKIILRFDKFDQIRCIAKIAPRSVGEMHVFRDIPPKAENVVDSALI